MQSTLFRNVRVATCTGPRATHDTSEELLRELALLEAHDVLWEDGVTKAMVETGTRLELPQHTRVVDGNGKLLTAALVDCHTHAAFAGDRVRDFRDKMAGIPYEVIAARGGGIGHTVRATQAASDEELRARVNAAADHAREAFGIGALEVKTGYGGSVEQELRLLRLLLELCAQEHHTLVPTWLGLHGPPSGDRTQYLEDHTEALARAKQLYEGTRGKHTAVVDVYLDRNAWSLEECRGYLARAKELGFALRGHVGQFADLGGAELLASLGARSCDHLEQVSDAGLHAMAAAQTTAVLLPGAWSTLRQKAPDAPRFAHMGVRMAVATDFNPGTSPTQNLQLCAALAVRDAGLHPDAALLAITRRAAEVLGVKLGTIRVGQRGNLVLWNTDEPAAFGYYLGDLSYSHATYR